MPSAPELPPSPGPAGAPPRSAPAWRRAAALVGSLGRASDDVQLIPKPLQVTGAAAIAFFVARADPAPALHGRGAVVLVGLVVGVGALLALPRPGRGRPGVELAALWTMALCGGALCWASPPSPGSALSFAAVYAAGARWPAQRVVPLVAAAIVAVAISALVYGGGFAGSAAYAGGFVALALFGVNRRQFLHRVEETELLLARLQRSREEQVRAAALGERTRIARDVHDVLAHSLAGLTIQLDAARLLLERSDPDGRPLAFVDRAHGLAREGLREAREAVGALHGDAVPLRTGLEELVADHRQAGGDARLRVVGDPDALGPDAAWALLRIAREAVTNAHKHAPGHALAVTLAVGPRDAVLEVVDRAAVAAVASGLAATGGGYGLRGMTDRAEAIGGTLEAGPADDGWRVAARVPLPAPAGGVDA